MYNKSNKLTTLDENELLIDHSTPTVDRLTLNLMMLYLPFDRKAVEQK